MTTHFEQGSKELIALKEKELLVKRWDKTGILKNLIDGQKQESALLLENQRLFNEMSNDSGDVAQFKRISIPLVRRIMGSLAAFKLASVQGMLGPNSTVFFFHKNKLVSETITARTLKMKAVWAYEAIKDLRSQFNLDAEAELTAVLAQELTMELDRIMLTAIRNNAALKKEIDYSHISGELQNEKFAKIQDYIYELGSESKRLYGRPFPNWIVVSPEMAKAICPKEDEYSWLGSIGFSRHGTLMTEEGEIVVYKDPLGPTGTIIMGYKGEHAFDAGYIFAPYVLLDQTPVVLDPDSFMPRKGILCRFGQHMADATYYSTLTVKNFKVEEEAPAPVPNQLTFNFDAPELIA